MKMVLNFSSVLNKKVFQKVVPKLDFNALQVIPELRKTVGKAVDDLLVALKKKGESVTYKRCMDIVYSVCELFVPKIPKRSKAKGDWFDPYDVEMSRLLVNRKMIRELQLEYKYSVVYKK